MTQIIPFPDRPFVYVPKNHEVIRIINKNSSRLNLVLSDADLMEGGVYYRVDRTIVDRVVDEVRLGLGFGFFFRFSLIKTVKNSCTPTCSARCRT
jgi:hypothetical protein